MALLQLFVKNIVSSVNSFVPGRTGKKLKCCDNEASNPLSELLRTWVLEDVICLSSGTRRPWKAFSRLLFIYINELTH